MWEKKPTCDSLEIDQACLIIKSEVEALFQMQYNECEKCSYLAPVSVDPRNESSLVVGTQYPATFFVEAGSLRCELSHHLREHGRYNLLVQNETASKLACRIHAPNEPSAVTAYIPIIVAVCIYVGLGLLSILSVALYKKCSFIFNRIIRNDSMSESIHNPVDGSGIRSSDEGSVQQESKPAAPKKKRLISLDTFRGIAIVVMIFVNYGGGEYFFFDHLPWNGLSFADLVFPWFIWIMGVSMTMSLRSLLRRATPKTRITYKIVKRTIILFSLGIILNTSYGANDLTKLRIPGVLQRFAISYFVVAFVHMFFARTADSHTERRWAPVRDLVLYWGEWLGMTALLLVYLLLTFVMPVPGCPTGYLGPGGFHENSSHVNCTGGAAGYIDRKFFGAEHIYGNPTCKKMYGTNVPYDPEGLLGSLTSIFLVFLGLQAGKILHTYSDWKSRIGRWLAWGIVLGLLAALLCKGSKNDGWIPVNKNLWSLSFILTTASFAFTLLSICYYLQDVRNWWNGTPFFYPGMNSILLYVGHQLTGTLFPWGFKVPNTHGAQLAVDLWGASLWVIIAYVLHRKKIFLSI